VEGKIDISEFKNEFDNNNMVKVTLENDPLFYKVSEYINYFMFSEQENIFSYLAKQNWETSGGRLNIWGEVEKFLSRYNHPTKPTKKYEEDYTFLLEIQPKWLMIYGNLKDETFVINNVIKEIPRDIKSKKDAVKWCKDKIKELFKYDKLPPRWIQNAEWPIIGGRPLRFKGQSEERNAEQVFYYFYDPDTGEETKITQLY
jgi:hypothetical protein